MVVYSSFSFPRQDYFDGFAFVGKDYISGADGARKFSTETGLKIRGGEDGCYISIWRESGLLRFGVDHSGNMKLFTYYKDGVWGVSNSVVALADHLRANGVSLRANSTQLFGLGLSGPSGFNEQLVSFDTVIDGITLVDTKSEVVVENGSLVVEERQARPSVSYEEALTTYLESWVGRFETLLSIPGASITCDLSGGKDSRLVFGLLMAAKDRLKLDNRDMPVFHSNKTVGLEENDYETAQTVAGAFGQVLNAKPKPIVDDSVYNATHRYSQWRNLCLTCYHPLYFPMRSQSPLRIGLGGGGGGNHRPFFPFSTFDDFAKRYRRICPNQPMLENWLGSVRAVCDQAEKKNFGHAPWIFHYRELRSRFHAGRASQYRSLIAPLSSGLMDDLSIYPGKTVEAQAHFDVMASLSEPLMLMPYNKPGKGPTERTLANLMRVGISRLSDPGRAYIEEPRQVIQPERAESCFDLLGADLEATFTSGCSDLFPVLTTLARDEYLRAVGNPDHQTGNGLSNISRLLTADYALSFG